MPVQSIAENGTATQDGHIIAIDTPLGKDALLLTAVDGVDAVSRGFTYKVEFMTAAPPAEVYGLIGRAVTVWLGNNVAATRRPLHGHVRSLTQRSATVRGYDRWQAEVAPWLSFLANSVDCRPFQDLTVPEILAQVFREHGLTEFEFRLHDTYPKREFCVQYRESALAFVSRLLEHEGISYWFEHEARRHLLVLADNNVFGKFTAPRVLVQASEPALGPVQEVEYSYIFRPGRWALSDYDFVVPTKNLRVNQPTLLPIEPMKSFEVFDYPGSFDAADLGANLTRRRIEQEEARHHEVSGTGVHAGLDPGRRFALQTIDGARSGEGGEPKLYFATAVHHSARDDSHFNTSTLPVYTNRFTAIPDLTPFRPERLTARPVVQGPQTAMVVGPAGKAIHTDMYGRVRVLFHWDRRGKPDERASCWIRVSQHSASAQWGALSTPHLGDEVVVSFLEGDPDRPLITGRVHNGTHMPPVMLPRDEHKTVVRDHGDNRIIMHGKTGQERLSLVSPRNINLVAMRRPARGLSAQTIDDVSFDDYHDATSLSELFKVYQELRKKEGLPQVQGGIPPKTGFVYAAPDSSGLADAAASVDINTMSEHDINSLSVVNTNAWVGGDANTWINGDSHTRVNGVTTFVGAKLVTNKAPIQNDLIGEHSEETVLHLEETGIHLEETQVHLEHHLAMHMENHTGSHIESHAGLHSETHMGTHFENHVGTHTQVGTDKIEDDAEKLKTSKALTELHTSVTTITDNYNHLTTQVHNLQCSTYTLKSLINIQINAPIINIQGPQLNILNVLVNIG